MPGLIALNRRWRIGSDDLGLPAALEAAGHLAWIGSFATVFFRHRNNFDCLGGSILQRFYTGGLLISGMNVVLLLAMIRCSLKGTLINAEPRRKTASALVAAKCLMNLSILTFSIVSTRWAYFMDYGCEEHIVRTMQNALKGFWASTLSSAVALTFILTPTPVQKRKPDDLETSESVGSATRKAWGKRMEGLSKLLGIEGHPAVNSIADLLTDFFKEEADIVPSDLMVALMILTKEQKERNTMLRRQVLGTGSIPAHHPKMRQWMTPENAAHYMRFACGCYGWPMYVFSTPLASFGLMKVLMRGRYIPRGLPNHIEYDNKLMANTTVIKMVTGLTDNDIVYATFHNKLFEIPFYVALDHKMKSVVVAIRGSLSLEDVLTDLMAFESESFSLPGVPDASAHEGMLATARYILKRLTGRDSHGRRASSERPLLESAYHQLEQYVGPDIAKDYDLVIVGHSLGAGVAAILSILLRKMPQYGNLKCFAFSPPGGLLSLSAAEHAESFVCSVVLGDDIVGRLGLRSVFELKIKIFQILQTCDIGKHEVVGNWIINLMNRLLGRNLKNFQQKGNSWNNDPDAQCLVEKFQSEIQKAIDSSKESILNQCEMFPPGCVLYIDEQKKKGWFSGRPSYTAAFTTCDSGLFREVFLGGEMMRHHMPWIVLEALQNTSFKL